MKNQKSATVCILLAAALWGTIGVFFKLLTAAGLTSMQSVAVRCTGSAVFYTVYLLVTDPAALKIRLRDSYYFVGTGIVSLVFFNYCYFNTIERSSMAIAAILLYTAPIFVMLLSALLFREKMTVRKLIALAVTFAGCVFVTGMVGGGERLTGTSVLFGLGAGLGYALYSIFGTFALRKYSSKTVTVYTFILAAIGVLPVANVGEMLPKLLTWQAVVGGLGISIFCCILPYIFYTKGLTGMEPGRASIIATLEPVVAAVLGITCYHETVTIAKLIGIILVVSAIVLLNYNGKKRKVRESHA